MEAVGVVEAFYIGKEVSPGLFFGCVDAVMDAFGLERVKEALHRRITPAIALAAHGGRDVGRGQCLPVGLGCILNASIRMMNEPGCGALSFQSHG